jgi:hypothetical protein
LYISKLKQTGLVSLLASTLLLTFSASTMAAGSKGKVEPLFTRYAKTYKAPTLDLKVENFNDKPMEEMNNFNGYTVTADFTYPINEVSQIELLLPLYTDAKGRLNDDPAHPLEGRNLDVKGYGGVRDFASLIYEREMPDFGKDLGVNIAWLFGAGYVLDTIDVKHKGKVVDMYNHAGYNLQAGLKIDTDIQNGDITLFSNLRYIQYLDSDDINYKPPKSADGHSRVVFRAVHFNNAIMFNNFGNITPVLELMYVNSYRSYSALTLSPEIVYSMSSKMDIKFGVPFKLSSDGDNYAAVLEGTYRF